MKTLIFSGSLRQNAFTKQIAKLAHEVTPNSTYLELNDYPMPLLNQDEADAPFPEAVQAFRQQLKEHDQWVIVTAEHNGSIPASLKNALDWASRKENESEGMTALYQMRPILIISASPGPFGGIRAANHLRQIVMGMGAAVFPKGKTYIKVSPESIKESKETLQSLLSKFSASHSSSDCKH